MTADATRPRLSPRRRLTPAELHAFLDKAADILRGNVDHSEFRGQVFALLFFKRLSDVYEEAVGKPATGRTADQALPFVVPAACLWERVTNGTRDRPVPATQLGQSLNAALRAIERANAPKFDGILTSKIDFNNPDALPRSKLVELKNHFASRKFDRAHVHDDLFGDAYEYLIRQFASKAGPSSGEFYTPREVSYLMAEMIEPAERHEVCDWASGSGSLLLQCREYLRRRGQDPNRLVLFAQESNAVTYNIGRLNLLLHGITSWTPAHGDSLRAPRHLTRDQRLRRFDRIVMNPPFALESWGFDDFKDGDPHDRFVHGMPPRSNGDTAWMQHVARSLKPAGKAILVMSQGILFRGQPALSEAEDGRNKKADDEYLIRAGLLRDDLVEAVIVLPAGLFYGNNVPACLVFLNRRKPAARRRRVLLIWAARHYQHARPQCLLRRADCLRILLPWRAFGDLATARALLPAEARSILDEIERDRTQALREITVAYDPVLAPLADLKAEAHDLSAAGFQQWRASPDAAHAAWGQLAEATKEIDVLEAGLADLRRGAGEKKTLRDKLRSKKTALNARTRRLKEQARQRQQVVQGQLKALARVQQERTEQILALNRRASRETAEVNEALADLQRICADPAVARRYFVVAEMAEIEDNEFNLNLPRYVDTWAVPADAPLDVAIHAFKTLYERDQEATGSLSAALERLLQ